jgi:hypothetical protein
MSLLRLDVIVSTPSLMLCCCYVALRDSFASFRPVGWFCHHFSPSTARDDGLAIDSVTMVIQLSSG